MPYKIAKNKDGSYRLTGPSGVHAKHTTLAKAQAQQRLLNAKEHNPSFKPRGSAKRKKGKG